MGEGNAVFHVSNRDGIDIAGRVEKSDVYDTKMLAWEYPSRKSSDFVDGTYALLRSERVAFMIVLPAKSYMKYFQMEIWRDVPWCYDGYGRSC